MLTFELCFMRSICYFVFNDCLALFWGLHCWGKLAEKSDDGIKYSLLRMFCQHVKQMKSGLMILLAGSSYFKGCTNYSYNYDLLAAPWTLELVVTVQDFHLCSDFLWCTSCFPIDLNHIWNQMVISQWWCIVRFYIYNKTHKHTQICIYLIICIHRG